MQRISDKVDSRGPMAASVNGAHRPEIKNGTGNGAQNDPLYGISPAADEQLKNLFYRRGGAAALLSSLGIIDRHPEPHSGEK